MRTTQEEIETERMDGGVGRGARPSRSDMTIARRHIASQTGILISDQQLLGLWRRSGLGGIVLESGRVDRWVCVGLVDALCFELLGRVWPLNGETGDDNEPFFHRFTTQAVEAGYALEEQAAA